MEAVRVMVVDDHTLFRQGVVSLLQAHSQVKVIGEASDGAEAVDRVQELMPDIILMDIRMQRMSGIEATRQIRRLMPSANIIILTVSEKDDDLFEAIKSGAKGYVLKTIEAEDLVKAILAVSSGEAAIMPSMAAKLLSEFTWMAEREESQSRAAGTELTEREKDVLRLLARGASNREISESLFITENTVKTHLKNILEKLHLHNRIQAAAYAFQEGLASVSTEKRSPIPGD